MSKNVLLFGGAFDPVHKGHRVTATVAYDHLAQHGMCNEVWFLPCFSDAYGVKEMASAEHRVNMLQVLLNTLNRPNFRVCTHEIEMANKAGTYAVVKSLIAAYPTINFTYLIGYDCAVSIRKWRNSRDLVKTIPFVVVNRRGMIDFSNIWWYNQPPHRYLSKPAIDAVISSTQIRDDYRANPTKYHDEIHPMLDISVQKYINDKELYHPFSLPKEAKHGEPKYIF